MVERLGLAVQGDLEKQLKRDLRRGGWAVKDGLNEVKNGAVRELKSDSKSAGLGNLGRRLRGRFFKSRDQNNPLGGRILIWPHGGDRLRSAFDAFSEGATIRGKGGRYVWIPTGFNLRSGRRGSGRRNRADSQKFGTRVIYTPDELMKGGGGFIRKSKNGTMILFAKVAQASAKKKGVVRKQAYVNDHLLGSGRIRRTESILEAGAVPMFVLKRQVQIRKRLNTGAILGRWAKRTPAYIEKHWRRIVERDNRRAGP